MPKELRFENGEVVDADADSEDHRLAGAEPAHQPDADEDAPHRLAGALPRTQPEGE
jgi:hypothetical protein